MGHEGDAPRLIVFEFRTPRTYSLPIEPATMRFPTLESIDAKWIEHHFEWVPRQGEPQLLRQRAAFVPLPRRGNLTVDRNDGYREYRIQRSGRRSSQRSSRS